MPAQSDTPNVASAVREPASVEYLPPPSDYKHVRKRERLSDMGTPKTGSAQRVYLDLSPMSDDIRWSEMDWQQREKFRYRQTVDLRPGDYKVNGRGHIMRAAVKLARQIVKGGKRLPKHLFKELVLSLLDMILSNLPGYLQTEIGTGLAQTPDGWVFRSYGALQSGAGIPLELLQEAATGFHPGVGKTKWGQSIYDPLGYGAGPQPAYMAAISGQAVGNTAPSWNRRGLFIQDNLVPRYSHVASYVNTYPVTGVNKPWPATLKEQKKALLTGVSMLNAPFTSTLSERGSVTSNPVRVAVKQKDVKLSSPAWMNGPFNIAMAATELADTIDCLYKALPPWERYGRDYTDKMDRVFDAFETVDWGKAVGCMMFNQVTDKMFVTVKRAVDKRLRSQSINGMSYQYGVTYGGGPTGYLDLTW